MGNPGVQFKPPNVQQPIAETPPKRTAAPKAAPRKTSTNLKSEIGGMLVTANVVIAMLPPTRNDRLDSVEIEALADAIYEECMQSARFRKYVEAAVGMGSGLGLLGIVGIIGARRAARHGVIPAEADQELGNLLARGVHEKRNRDAAGVL